MTDQQDSQQAEAPRPHPAAEAALQWILSLPVDVVLKYEAGFERLVHERNPLGLVCSATLDKLAQGQEVSDTEVLGLAWLLRDLIEGPPSIPTL